MLWDLTFEHLRGNNLISAALSYYGCFLLRFTPSLGAYCSVIAC